MKGNHMMKVTSVMATAMAAACLLLGAGPARAAVVFFDDFEDEGANNNPPAINASIGGDDLADVGGSWTGTLTDDAGQPYNVQNTAGDGYLDLGDVAGSKTANFTAVDLTAGGTITLDTFFDYTPSGSTTASIVVYDGGTQALTLLLRRGSTSDTTNRRSIVYSNGAGTGILNITDADLWHSITLTLGATGYSLGVAGEGSVGSLAYINAVTSVNNVFFQNGTNGNARQFYVDDVTVTQNEVVTVPAPAAMPAGMMALAVAVMRRRRDR